MNTELYDTKVDKVLGKDLSSNDYTITDKNKLDGIEEGAEVNVQANWNQNDDTQDDFIIGKPEQLFSSLGYFHHNDLATQTTALTLVANVEKKITNDTLGAQTNLTQAPYGVTNVWNSTTNSFDFSELSVGDTIDLRIDLSLTTLSNNQKYSVFLRVGEGSVAEYDLLIDEGIIKSTSTNNHLVGEVGLSLDYAEHLANPANLYIVSDHAGSVKVNGFYTKILRKGINIITIGAGVDFQQVTDNNNVTTNPILIPELQLYDTATDAYAKISYLDGQFDFRDINGRIIKVIEKDGLEQTININDFYLTKEISSLTANRQRTEPDKDGTYAMLDDILPSAWKEPAELLLLNADVVQGGGLPQISGLTIQGHTLVQGSRVVVTEYNVPAFNGIYRVGSGPIIGTGNYLLVRTNDANSTTELNNAVIGITNGTFGGKTYRQTTANPVINTTTINFVEFAPTITIDATPTDGSSNAVSSNGVFDALALKQNVLTNPITGTGANGQVTFFNGTTTQTGDNGLFWDNTNKRLGVGTNAPATRVDIQGTTATDSAALGAELLSSLGWTTVGWTGDFVNGFQHTTGNTNVLSNPLAAVVNTYYQLDITTSGRTAGSVTVAFGGQSVGAGTSNAVVNFGPRATTTGNLTITPTSDFDGTIVISIRTISNYGATVTFKNSSGVVVNDIRNHSINSNTFVGRSAGQRNTTGFSNSFFGQAAGSNNTTGNSNSFVGVQAGFNNTTGGNNSFFGRDAGTNNTTGGNNSFVGVNAGRFISSGGNLTIANNSVFLGVDTRAAADNQTNQIVIGHNAIGLGSNSSVIGNTSTTLFRPYGNVAIGADTAGARLDVRAQGALSTDIAFRVRNSADNANLLEVRGNGNIGINTTTDAGFKLDVDGTARLNGSTTFGTLGSGTGMFWDNTNNRLGIGISNPAFRFVVSDGTRTGVFNPSSGLNAFTFGTTTNHPVVFVVNSNEYARIFTTGNFGIGTNSDVASSILTLASTTKGFLPPRMTNAQRLAIASPAVGLMVYCTDMVEGLYVNKSTGWQFII
jgi:hypothetical protein